MIKFEFTNMWTYNKLSKQYFELITCKFMASKSSWYRWYFELTILNFNIELYWEK